MAIEGILVDINYCTGCEACIVACQQEHNYSEKEKGIRVEKYGPICINEAEKHYEFDYTPLFTDWCDGCARRRAKGKLPTCVQHCQAQCLSWGPMGELAGKITDHKQMIYAIQAAA